MLIVVRPVNASFGGGVLSANRQSTCARRCFPPEVARNDEAASGCPPSEDALSSFKTEVATPMQIYAWISPSACRTMLLSKTTRFIGVQIAVTRASKVRRTARQEILSSSPTNCELTIWRSLQSAAGRCEPVDDTPAYVLNQIQRQTTAMRGAHHVPTTSARNERFSGAVADVTSASLT